MRTKLLLTLALPGVILIAGGATAQQRGGGDRPTVEGYLCTFAGKCDGVEAPQATRDAPATKGFRLARPVAESNASATPAARAVSTRGPERRAAAATPGRGRGIGGAAAVAAANRASGYSAAAPMPAAGTGVARPRADLMIGFHLNSDQLTPEGREAAQVFARSLQMPELRDRRFLIEGHTDLRGGRALNQSLSSRRAQAVADYLASLGVDRSRLQARGLGYSAPLPGHAVTDPANRRVEAELIR